MRRVELTSRGAGVISALPLLALFAWASEDPLLTVVLVIVSLLVLYDLLWLRVAVKKPCTCTTSVSERVWVWDRPTLTLELSCRYVGEVAELPSWAELESLNVFEDRVEVRLRTSFPHYGSYVLDEITAVVPGRLGLFNIYETVPLQVEYQVLPETLYWIVIALGVLGLRVGGEVYKEYYEFERPTVTRSVSGVYYETRDYLPGDPIKRVDWKATSRRLKLMIKEYREESGSGVSLYLDGECVGPLTCDEVASAFLSVVLATSRSGAFLELVDLSRDVTVKPRSSRAAVAYALKRVFEMNVVEELDLYEYVEPTTVREIRDLLSKIVEGEVVWKPKLSIVEPDKSCVIVTALASNLPRIVSLVEEASNRNNPPIVIVPSKPWVDVRDLEDAYRYYVTYRLATEKLKRLNARVVQWRRLGMKRLKSYP